MNRQELISPAYKANRILIAGFIGISANTVALKLAPLFHVDPGAGGLLQLLLLYASRTLPWIVPFMHSLGLTKPPSLIGYLWFHYLTGLGMIALYFYGIAWWLPGPRWWRGTLFSIFPWLINSAIVLPQLGQGFAGLKTLAPSGVLYFFFANWICFVVAAICCPAEDRILPSELQKAGLAGASE